MRKANYPTNGHIFRNKSNTDLFSRTLYLADGETIDEWEEITEEEYAAIVAEQKRAAREMMSRM